MSEETHSVICSLIWASVIVATIFFLSSCVSSCDERQSERTLREQQQDHELRMEHARQGHQFVEKGSWIKRQPVEQP